MQVLVTYYSRTGTTKKLAEHVARGVRQVPGVDCLLKPCAEVTREHFLASDAIIVGSPVYFNRSRVRSSVVDDRHALPPTGSSSRFS
jgi:NAD(P)H dehydrogenase (quinone)